MPWQIGSRNGDTEMSERQKQKRNMPEVLIITPESLHLLLAQKDYEETFKSLKIIAVDEWHELIGSKRGVQVELALSRIIGSQKAKNKLQIVEETTEKVTGKKQKAERVVPPAQLSVWGISATIGNLRRSQRCFISST